MKKTTDYIKIVLLNGKEQKRTIYVDESGAKYIYNQRVFWKLEDFIKGRKPYYTHPSDESLTATSRNGD